MLRRQPYVYTLRTRQGKNSGGSTRASRASDDKLECALPLPSNNVGLERKLTGRDHTKQTSNGRPGLHIDHKQRMCIHNHKHTNLGNV